MKSTVLVTGASGYIGKYLATKLHKSGYSAFGTVRTIEDCKKPHDYSDLRHIGSIDGNTSWEDALKGIDHVIHLAGSAHNIGKKSKDFSDQLKIVNTDATANLVKKCVDHGVKRFIFISSIGVLGDDSISGTLNNHSTYNPQNPYSVSKMEAERAIEALSGSHMSVIILRPPLVYGPGAPGNFHRLLRLVSWFRVLPFGSFFSSRNMISLENLCDLIVHCLEIPTLSKNKFVVSDGSDWTTKELVGLISELMHRWFFNISVPISILSLIARCFNRSEELNRLSRPLRIDSQETTELLGWFPKQKPIEGLKEAVEYYQKQR